MSSYDESIAELLVKLQDPDPVTRIEACERLRALPDLSPQAIEALQETANDLDHGVPEAARRALAAHLPTAPAVEPIPPPAAVPMVEQTIPAKHYKWHEVWVKALTHPSTESFTEIINDPSAGMKRGLIWLFIAAILYSLIYLGMDIAISGQTIFADIGIYPIGQYLLVLGCMVPFLIVILLIANLLSIGLIHVAARLFGGKGSYGMLVYGTAAFSAPLLLINGIITHIPIIKLLVYIVDLYVFVLWVISVKAVHKFETGRAAAVVIIPSFVLGILMVIIGVVVLAPIMNGY
jgi:hypothetical protein